MAARPLTRLLDQLQEAWRRVGEMDPARLERLLANLGSRRFPDAASLLRFHDGLLFLRAHPPNSRVLRQTESLLASFSGRVEKLRLAGADLTLFDEEEAAGIAGTTLTAVFHYDQVGWLAKNFPGRVSLDWNGYERPERLAATLPRFVPLLEEDARVEADVPYLEWLRAASGGARNDLRWLLGGCEGLPLSSEERAEVFGSLELPIRWELGDSHATRTHGYRPVREIFYQRAPLIRRNQVSLVQELATPIAGKRLSERAGARILDLCREATTVRYRELYGTTRGDPRQVVCAQVGRGIEVFLWGLPPDRRLPLRAYQAGFTLKNGVPINYIEGISLFEWMEIGFNTFYAYRDGETAWVYAKVLRLLHQILGATCISVYPYQIGQDNEEAIASGAFWFYRKLGFRPMRPELARLAEKEERKIAAHPGYRTPARVLRRLAQGHLVYEMPGTGRGDWDSFRMRDLGFKIQRRMAARYGGNASRLRTAASATVARQLGVDLSGWKGMELRAFENWALLLAMIPGLGRWSLTDKRNLERAIRAKAASTESSYAHLLLEQTRLRQAILALG